MSANDYQIVAGEHSFSIDAGIEQRSIIESIIIHEDYDPVSLTNDIW
jgi:hypothetical protein